MLLNLLHRKSMLQHNTVRLFFSVVKIIESVSVVCLVLNKIVHSQMLKSVEPVQRHFTDNKGLFVFKEVTASLDVVPDEVPSVPAQ